MKRSLLLIPGFFLALALIAQPTVLFEEQFDGGIPDNWDVGAGEPAGAAWQWSATGKADNALVDGATTPAIFWGSLGAVNSPSANNGAAMYNSDVYDAGGISVGQGPYPNGTVGRLTSPPVDCSGQPNVYLTFYQYARINSQAVSTFVEVSNDNGESWVDFPINQKVLINRSTNRSDFQFIDISEVAANQPDVRVRFTWDGRYYFWLIDDVQLITPPKYALSIDSIFYTPASYAQPVSQIATDTFSFFVFASNRGSDPIPNLVLKASVLEVVGNNNTQLVYQDSLVLDVFPALAKDSVLEITNRWAPELDLGNYRIRYEIYAQDPEIKAQDYTPSNDAFTVPFRVTAIMFAMEDAPANAPNFAFRPGTGGDYSIGNFYQMSPQAGNNFQIRELRFAAAKNESDGPLAGSEVTLLVYKVKDEIEPNFSNFDDSSDESLELVGFGLFEFSDSDQDLEIVLADVFDFDGNPIALEANGRYFVMASYTESSNVIFHAFYDDVDYIRRVSTVLFRDQWFLGGFGSEYSAVMRMVIELSTATDETPLEDNAMTLFPNPSSEVLQVQLNLQEATPAMLIMADMQGQVLDLREYQNVQKETMQFDVSHLPAGAYLMRVSTDAGTKTKQFVVAR